jgi:hypothetical protein
MKISKVLLIYILLSTNIFGQNENSIIWDKNASSISSSRNLLTLHSIIYEFEDEKLKLSYWNEDNLKRKLLGIGYRFTKTVLLDYQVDFLVHLFQHEVFGHGYRYREFEYEDNSYGLNAAPPYGNGSGFAVRGMTNYNRDLGIHEEIAIRSGGMESASVLSNSIKKRWLFRGKMNYRESLLFLSTFHDYTVYILATKYFNNNSEGNDVRNYLRTINESYGFIDERDYRLTIDDLSRKASINLLNTFNLYATYTYLKKYLLDGEREFEYPTIKIGNKELLPSIRFGLTPFGSEFVVENYVRTERNIIGFNFRIGDNKLDNFWGLGCLYHKKISDNFSFTSQLDTWVQPEMELGGITTFNTNDGFGARFVSEFNLYIGRSFPIGIYGQVGYKSSGFIEGEILDKGPIVRLGISFRD